MEAPSRDAGPLAMVRSRLGSLRRNLRRALDRSLHPGRQRRALDRLRRWPVPRRILVLCLGNVCRSPYVEASLRKSARELGLELEVGSAGFIGPGRTPPPEALEAAARRGVDTGGHLSRLVSALPDDGVDLVLLVDPGHGGRMRRQRPNTTTRFLVLGDLDPEPADSRTIPDPWGHPAEVYDAVFARLDRCLEVLLNEWKLRAAR